MGGEVGGGVAAGGGGVGGVAVPVGDVVPVGVEAERVGVLLGGT